MARSDLRVNLLWQGGAGGGRGKRCRAKEGAVKGAGAGQWQLWGRVVIEGEIQQRGFTLSIPLVCLLLVIWATVLRVYVVVSLATGWSQLNAAAVAAVSLPPPSLDYASAQCLQINPDAHFVIVELK